MIVTTRRESVALIDQNTMAARRAATAVVASIDRVIPPGVCEKIV